MPRLASGVAVFSELLVRGGHRPCPCLSVLPFPLGFLFTKEEFTDNKKEMFSCGSSPSSG